MNFLSKFTFNGATFFLHLNDTDSLETYSLLTTRHVEDRVASISGGESKYPELRSFADFDIFKKKKQKKIKVDELGLPVFSMEDFQEGENYSEGVGTANVATDGTTATISLNDYLVESVCLRKKSGRVFKYGNSKIILAIINAIKGAKSYQFEKDNIVIDNKSFIDGKESISFSAMDENVRLSYKKVNGIYTELTMKFHNIEIDMQPVTFTLKVDKNKYTELESKPLEQYLVASLKRIDYETLCNFLDMSWYKENGVKKKNYNHISSKEDFELNIMTAMIKAIIAAHRKGEPFYVAIDTETTGLKVYNLSKDNPAKDHCVAIPICWKDDESYVIFTDMENFNNVDNQYVVDRLAELFENFKGEREIEYWDYEDETSENFNNNVGDMNSFVNHSTGFNADAELDADDLTMPFVSPTTTFNNSANGPRKLVKKKLKFSRDWIQTIGHNSGFDARVFFDSKKKIYFDHDTLQMAFDICSELVRGSKGLKALTRYFFNAETPELSDILGKGNEDKYRYLEDLEVAEIYGCADGDFTRKLFFKLKHLMDPKLFYWYRKLDMPMINILAYSEYWGMDTYEDDVLELAKNCKESIEILKEAFYSYTGMYIGYSNKIKTIQAKASVGFYNSEEEIKEALANVQVNESDKYQFEFKPAALKHVLFDIMHYPILAYTDDSKTTIKLDKWVIDKLLKEKLGEGEKPFRELKKDILVAGTDYDEYLELKQTNPKAAASKVLISAEKFNKLKYPLALIIQKYSELNKEYTSYYKPIEKENLEGKIFKSYNMARIQTRRIANPGQTMKGNLKALVKAYGDDMYQVDFDMSQVEQRIMVSLSGFTELIEKMRDPENDAHTETASMVEGKAPYLVTVKERKKSKSVTFGKPFGLGLRKLCEKMFGDTTDEHMFEAALASAKWEKGNAPIVALMEKARLEALTEWHISDELRDFMHMWKTDENGEYVLDENGNKIKIPIGRVTNILGFYRIFSLENIDLTPAGVARRAKGEYTKEESSIRRKAGNFPIQGTASEFFRTILINFYNACEDYGIQDKVKWHMLIHDELLCSVSKDVHPFLIYKIIKNACMFTLPGHTNYYVGINIGDNWEQCKDDEREAPIHFVDRMIKRYDAGEFEEGWFDHPWDFIKPYMDQYFEDRICEVIKRYQPNVDNEPINVPLLLETFSNYTVRKYVFRYPTNGDIGYKATKGDSASEARENDLKWMKSLESWALDRYGEGKQMIDLDGKLVSLHRAEKTVSAAKEVNVDELFANDFMEEDDTYWSFDSGSAEILYTENTEDLTSRDDYDLEDDFEYDFSRKGDNVVDFTVLKHKYNHLKKLGDTLFVTLADYGEVETIQNILAKEVTDKDGIRIVFQVDGSRERWLKIRDGFDLNTLDTIIEFLANKEQLFTKIDDCILIKDFSRVSCRTLTESLARYSGNTSRVFAGTRILKQIATINSSVDTEKLENLTTMIRTKMKEVI